MSTNDPEEDPPESPSDEEILEHVFVKVAKQPKLLGALKAAGVIEIADLFCLSVLQCNQKTKPSLVHVDTAFIRIIRAYNHYRELINDPIDPSDWINLTKQQYDRFRLHDKWAKCPIV